MAKQQDLKTLLQPEIEALGYECWGVVYLPQGQHALLRVYIDHPNGITVDDCEKVSRQASALLDVEDMLKDRYTLEVSSPGLDRPLFELSQYSKVLNQTIEVRSHIPINKRRKWLGELMGIEGETLRLNTSEGSLDILFAQVERANVVPTYTRK